MSNLVGKKPKKPDWKRDLRMSRSNADHQGGLESVDPQSRCRLQTCILLNLISFAPPSHFKWTHHKITCCCQIRFNQIQNINNQEYTNIETWRKSRNQKSCKPGLAKLKPGCTQHLSSWTICTEACSISGVVPPVGQCWPQCSGVGCRCFETLSFPPPGWLPAVSVPPDKANYRSLYRSFWDKSNYN